MLAPWCRDKMAAIFQTTFSNAFSWTKIYEFRLRFHWSLFLWLQLTIFQHCFRKWLGAEQATSHYLKQWWYVALTHICVTRPQWVNVYRRAFSWWSLGTVPCANKSVQVHGVSNHRRLDCLLNRLFRRKSKETSKFPVTGHGWIPLTKGQ